jgi:DNA-binding HxlR family transcriptional regulator
VRAGGQTLILLGTPRIFLILRSLSEGAKGQRELRRDSGSPAQSTLRGYLKTLEEMGAVERRRRNSFPGALEYELAAPGRDLLEVAASLERWLGQGPAEGIELGSDPARGAIKGLVEGWSVKVMTTLAAGPLSLTELDKRISAISYPTIERCLETMRLAEQLDVGTRDNRGTPYAVTDWLRRGLTPLALAARWEHRHRPGGADPICRADIDDAVLLGGPLFKIPGRLNGLCRLAVEIPDGKKQQSVAGFLEVTDGRVTFAASRPDANPDAIVSGTTESWFATVLDADTADLSMGGDHKLASAIFDGVHQALFGPNGDSAPVLQKN